MKNQMDSRNRSAALIVHDLRELPGSPLVPPGRRLLAVLGSHQFDAGKLAEAMRRRWSTFTTVVGFEPVRIVTGCAPSGAEKAARMVARDVTGRLAVVFHRAEITYGRGPAEQMRDVLLAQEADALLVLTTGRKVCAHARDRFRGHGKKVHEIEVG